MTIIHCLCFMMCFNFLYSIPHLHSASYTNRMLSHPSPSHFKYPQRRLSYTSMFIRHRRCLLYDSSLIKIISRKIQDQRYDLSFLLSQRADPHSHGPIHQTTLYLSRQRGHLTTTYNRISRKAIETKPTLYLVIVTHHDALYPGHADQKNHRNLSLYPPMSVLSGLAFEPVLSVPWDTEREFLLMQKQDPKKDRMRPQEHTGAQGGNHHLTHGRRYPIQNTLARLF